jgi:SpoVK/Ycf46/Vps4 family AAA+-type ATPase
MLLISFTVLRKPNVIGLYLLQLYAKNLHLDEKVDLQTVAAFCNGYVGADLEALCREAAKLAYHIMLNISEGDKVLKLHMEDWESARSMVGPSIIRGVTKEISTVSWDDIGGLKDLKVRHFLFWFPYGKKPVLMGFFYF